jgi:hypothetical protein
VIISTAKLHIQCRLVLEVPSNSWKVHDSLDAKTGQQLLWPNTRELKDLRSVVSTSGNDDLAARLNIDRHAAVDCVARHELNDFESQRKGGIYDCP